MHDSARPKRTRSTHGIQNRVSIPPKSEWKINTYDQLPDHFKALLKWPVLTTKRAEELRGASRTKLYEEARKGLIKASRDEGTTLWDALSILLLLANLPPAPIKVDSNQALASPAAPPRRGR